jgi:toluene monooxygenase electron transfer component
MNSSPEPPSDPSRTSPYEVRVAGTELRFPAGPGDRLLSASRRAGVWLPFECGWGGCGMCKVALIHGEVETLLPGAPGISPQDGRRRRILTCQSAALSDLVVKARGTGPTLERPTRDYQAELISAEPVGPGISVFRFRLDGVSRYLPGQCAILDFGAELRRCYSMAGLPGSEIVEFIAKRQAGGPGSGALFAMKPGHTVAIELPYGDTWLRSTDRNVVLVAGGTGVSPILAMLRQLVHNAFARRVTVIYGANTQDDLACSRELRELASRLPAAGLRCVVARPPDGWDGESGLVTDSLRQLLADGPDAHNAADYYVAGPPLMVNASVTVLRDGGVSLDRVHYDSFG